MPTITYNGTIGSAVTLANPRTAELTPEALPTVPVIIRSAYVHAYLSTTARPYTYSLQVTTGGYTGTLDYHFPVVDSPLWVDIPISVADLDRAFPLTALTSVTIVDTGEHGSSVRVRGTIKVICEYSYVGDPVPPKDILLNGRAAMNIQAGFPAELSWTAGAPGSYDTFRYYQVKRFDQWDGTWNTLGTTTGTNFQVTIPYTDGQTYLYYVETVCWYKAARSSGYASAYSFIPLTEPIALNAGLNPIYNPRPRLLVELGDGPAGELLTFVADGWQPGRQGYPHSHIFVRRLAAYTQPTEETVQVTVTDERVRTVSCGIDVDYDPPAYTDPTIAAGGTEVKAAHITQLQDAFSALLAAYGMPSRTWTPCVAGETSLTVWPQHLAELQACAQDIATFINLWDPSDSANLVILPAMITAPGPSAAAINQLRDILRLF